jgi:hypothetical protein
MATGRKDAAMAKPDTIIVDGHALSWQRISELRRQQLEAWQAGQPRQLALFALQDDCRPPAERTVDGRYQEPSLWTLMDRGNED